jgi:hypothetical protein
VIPITNTSLLNRIYVHNDTIFLDTYYFARFNSTFYKNLILAIDQPFINLENDFVTLKAKGDILLIEYFNSRIGQAQSNILTHNSNLNPLFIEDDVDLTLEYKRSFEDVEMNSYDTKLLEMIL